MPRSRNREKAQVLAEAALSLPLLLLLAAGAVQLGFVAYASSIARYAAFVCMRQASVDPAGRGAQSIRAHVVQVVGGVAAIRMVKVEFKPSEETSRASPGSLNVTLGVPRVTPFWRGGLCEVTARCSMPLEPDW